MSLVIIIVIDTLCPYFYVRCGVFVAAVCTSSMCLSMCVAVRYRRASVTSCWWQYPRRFTAQRNVLNRSLLSWCCALARNTLWVELFAVKIPFRRFRFSLRIDLEFSVIQFEEDLYRNKSVACLLTQKEMHRADSLIDIVSAVTLRSMSREIRPRIYSVRYCYLHFLLPVYLRI